MLGEEGLAVWMLGAIDEGSRGLHNLPGDLQTFSAIARSCELPG